MGNNKQSSNKNKAVHVLHITSGDLWAGAEVMLLTLARALRNEFDTKVSIVILNQGTLEQKLREENFDVYLIDETKHNSLSLLRLLNRIIDQIKPDVIHTHRLKENILGSIAAWHNGRIPCLQTLHGKYEHDASLYKPHKYLKQLIDRLLTRYYQSYVIAVSPAMEDELKQLLPESKIRMITNGIAIEQLASNGYQPHQKEDKNRYRIGIAGRLTPVKRVDLFIASAILLKQHRPELNIHFHIYGEGPLLKELQQQAKNAGDYIHFEGHCDDIPNQLKTLDALIMTSDHEGLPMILLEAMCLSTPIIAHAVGGIPDLLDNGNCGVLVKQHKPEAFSGAIINLIEKPKEHQQLAEQAFERIEQAYSARQTASSYLETYRQLCR